MSVDLDRPTTAANGSDRRGQGSRRWPALVVGLVLGVVLGILGTIGVGALTGSVSPTLSGAASEIPAFAQPQQHADLIPTDVPGFDEAFIVRGSSRLAGEAGGISYYLSRSTRGQVCLLILPADPSKQWAQSCADGIPFAVSSAGAGSARVVGSTSPTPSGATRLGLNVLVDPASMSLNE
ncbi:hypothetical protein [Leifsonia shinshuensis]|uniref:Uncharacterized protein n=1 Tax=Leifsonia shinshuensis TaxID=150026 RepID=A0A7G6Y6D1_9MICO|nr:hypothetical protein [Leifsonia shinshuensis]QNE34046.1 hypothetical protein F1C12_02070 [Leifsonia shinshuensis]